MHGLVSFVLGDSKHISRAMVGDVVIHDSAEIMSCGVCLGVRTASVNPLAWYSSTRWPTALLGAFDSADRYAAYRRRLGRYASPRCLLPPNALCRAEAGLQRVHVVRKGRVVRPLVAGAAHRCDSRKASESPQGVGTLKKMSVSPWLRNDRSGGILRWTGIQKTCIYIQPSVGSAIRYE